MKRLHALVILFAAVAIFYKPLATGEVLRYRDHAHYFEPMRLFTSDELAAGNLPVWNPYNAAGEPWLANPQTGVFYPPAWIFLIVPFARAYTLYALIHALILGLGAYALFGRYATREAAMTGAVALVASGPMLSLIDVADNYGSFAWLPWIMWSASAAVAPAVGGVFIALSFLAGQPLFAAIGALLYVIVRRNLRDNATAGAIAFALSAIQLLPFLSMLRGSDRAAGFGAERIFGQSMPPLDWIRIAMFPHLTPSGGDPSLGQHYVAMVYLSVPVVVAAILGVIFGFRQRMARGWIVLLAFAFVFSAGSYLPTGRLIELIPGSVLRYPGRLVAFGALAIAGLAVIGWDRVRPKRAWLDVLVAVVILADLVLRAGPLLATEPFNRHRVPWPAPIGFDGRVFRLPTGEPTLADRDAWIFGYMNLFERRYDTGSAAPLYQLQYAEMFKRALQQPRMIDVIGGKYVLSDSALPLQPVGRVRTVTAFANDGAVPLATFWTEMPDERRASATAAALQMVIVTTRDVTVTMSAPSAGFVVLTQQDGRGWRAFVDGKEVEKLRAFTVFRAVKVDKGTHVIRWRYDAPGLRAGALLGLAGMVAAAFDFFTFRRRARRGPVLY